MDIGKIGIWTSYRPFGIERAGEAARLAEQLGYGAWWVGGSPHVRRPPPDPGGDIDARRGDRHPQRLEQRPRRDGRRRRGAARGLPRPVHARHRHRPPRGDERLPPAADDDARRSSTASTRSPTPPPAAERCLAALGPKMLDLAGERTAGTHPYFVPVEHTRLRPRAARPGQARRPRAGVRGRHRPGARQGRRPRLRAAVPRPAQLHAEPARLRLHRGRPRRRRLRPADRRRSSLRAAPSRSPRSSARTSTPAPTTSACSRWARRASRASPGPRSRKPWPASRRQRSAWLTAAAGSSSALRLVLAGAGCLPGESICSKASAASLVAGSYRIRRAAPAP